MSSSGVTNFSVTELDVIEEAASHIGVLENSQPLSATDVVTFRRKLNMLVKQWVGQADFAPGLKMWTRRRAYLFLSDTAEYTIGPNGDECAAESYVSMLLSISAAAAIGTVTVTDASAVAEDMRIGVMLTDGTYHWTTVTSVSGNNITLTAALPSSADAGGAVFAYTSKPVKPFEITSAVLRDTDGQDHPIDPNLSLIEYELIPSKASPGTPFSLYQEAKKDGMRVYLDCVPDDLTKVLRLVFHSYIEDTSAQTDDVDFPGEWFRALAAQLAMDAAPAFARPVTPELKVLRDESLRMAQNAHPARSDAYYQSEPDYY